MLSTLLDTHQKAVQINLDNTKYGTFAEIGAGQEVARWFFRVGGAAGTIAKSISAYDMTVSDAIYGPSAPVCHPRDRLGTMLDYEYRTLLRAAARRPSAARARRLLRLRRHRLRQATSTRTNECHGWMGIKVPGRRRLAEPSQIVVHVRMLDKRQRCRSSRRSGIIGVNLLHSAPSIITSDPDELIRQLPDRRPLRRADRDRHDRVLRAGLRARRQPIDEP